MCGACGQRVERDEWSDVLGSRRARWEAVQLVNELLADSGHPARLTWTAGSWLVRSGTGRDVVADSASQVWQAVQSVRRLDLDVVELLRGRSLTPVAVAVALSYGRRTGSVPCETPSLAGRV